MVNSREHANVIWYYWLKSGATLATYCRDYGGTRLFSFVDSMGLFRINHVPYSLVNKWNVVLLFIYHSHRLITMYITRYKYYLNHLHKNSVIDEAVIRRILTAEPRVQSLVTSSKIHDGWSVIGVGSSPSFFVFPLLTMIQLFLHIHVGGGVSIQVTNRYKK